MYEASVNIKGVLEYLRTPNYSVYRAMTDLMSEAGAVESQPHARTSRPGSTETAGAGNRPTSSRRKQKNAVARDATYRTIENEFLASNHDIMQKMALQMVRSNLRCRHAAFYPLPRVRTKPKPRRRS